VSPVMAQIGIHTLMNDYFFDYSKIIEETAGIWRAFHIDKFAGFDKNRRHGRAFR